VPSVGVWGSAGGAGRSSNPAWLAPSSVIGAAGAAGADGLRCLRWATASLGELGDMLDELRDLRALRRVLRTQCFDVEIADRHGVTTTPSRFAAAC
jgi:hypothetical protein